jgi:hypothetical protein
MSRKYNIRWSQSDEAELKRVVKNFNAKLSRLEKKDPKNANALPERVSAANLKDMITTRQDLNRELNALRRFSERGAEELEIIPDNYYNEKITKWQRKEMNRRASWINRNREIRREQIFGAEATSRGQKLKYSVAATMSEEEKAALQPINVFTKYQSRADIQQKYRTLKKQSQTAYWRERDNALREGYIKAVRQNLGTSAAVEEVVEHIRNMDVGEFRKIFDSDVSKFDVAYPANRDIAEENISELRSIWLPEEIGDLEELPY